MKIRFQVTSIAIFFLTFTILTTNATLGWLTQLFGHDSSYGNGYGSGYNPNFGYGNNYRPRPRPQPIWESKFNSLFGGNKDIFGFGKFKGNKWGNAGGSGKSGYNGGGGGWQSGGGGGYNPNPWIGLNNYRSDPDPRAGSFRQQRQGGHIFLK